MSLSTRSHQSPDTNDPDTDADADDAVTDTGRAPDGAGGQEVAAPHDSGSGSESGAGTEGGAGTDAAATGHDGGGDADGGDAGEGERPVHAPDGKPGTEPGDQPGTEPGDRSGTEAGDRSGTEAGGDGPDSGPGNRAGGGTDSTDSADEAGDVNAGDGTAAGHDEEQAGSPEPEVGTGDAPPAEVGRIGGWRARHPRSVKALAWTATALATVLVLFGLLLPNSFERMAFTSFTRIPAEGVLAAGLLLVLRPKARRVAAICLGAVLGLLTVVKFLDIGFQSVLRRPFDPVLDWILLEYGRSFLQETAGGTVALAALIGAVVVAVALPVLMALAVRRLSRIMVRHRTTATRTVLVLGTAWIVCATFAVHVSDVRIAARGNANLVQNRIEQVQASLRDEERFAELAAVDAFDDTPPEQLLTGLRGKDVLFTFIESYGRTALEDPDMAAEMDAALRDGTDRLRAAGFSSRSAFLGSPITGSGSWLAHSTFMSGLWVNNQQRYRTLTASDRLTLTRAFRRTGDWRTVGIMPGVRRAWPEEDFYGLDNVYDSREMGYQGPAFSWTQVPDQYSLATFERLEHGRKDRKPIMAAIILASSHNPWTPLPWMIDWDEIGDGSIYHEIKKAGKDPKEVWQDSDEVRTQYRRAIEYSVDSVVSYLEEYGDDDTVMVFLGDHQPVPTVTENKLGRDVPITIVARDEKVLDRISDWGWQDGLKPDPDAPVWRMDTFRDRFLRAYGPQNGPAASGTSAAAQP